MVAVIRSGKSFNRPLNYNEQKVQEGVATLLDAVNYPKNAEELSFKQKLNRLKKLAELNEKTRVNCVHISLNFDPSEKLSDIKLKEIAGLYMDRIGFGEQPYLLYRHDDAGHPHVHIVTTNIRGDGSRIELHNLGRVQSEKARKDIEQQYGLLRPEDSKQRQQVFRLNPVQATVATYGKTPTKRAITTVLNRVLPEFKYTSLPELNAVLKQYNIIADRGGPSSRTFENNGLVYRILGEDGERVGVPVKASDIFGSPTLKYLEARFADNDKARQTHKSRVTNAINWTLLNTNIPTLEKLIGSLKKQGIEMVLRQNNDGLIYGITYVDFQTKCVFNGSDLGKLYSAKAIQERCASIPVNERHAQDANLQIPDVAGTLLQQEYTGDTMPFELRQNKKKKRRGLSHH